jgi:hypothetical protein
MELTKFKFTLKDYKNFDKENREVYLYESSSCDSLLDEFYCRIIEKIDVKEHLPILRLADGEFQFLLGKNEFNLRKPPHKIIFHLIRQLSEKIFKPKYEAKSRTYTSGVYSHSDKDEVSVRYSECLKYIADKGILALYTIIKPNFYTEQYLPKLFDFLSTRNINIHRKNYVPFYFVYVILTNIRYSKIYQNKCVHLITSFDDARKESIEQSLFSFGVNSVSWTNISRDRSLFDEIDVGSIDKNVSLIFVGAGVGKVNIFNQLKDFPAVVVDAGYVFEIWQNPSLAKERDYCEVHI